MIIPTDKRELAIDAANRFQSEAVSERLFANSPLMSPEIRGRAARQAARLEFAEQILRALAAGEPVAFETLAAA
jgi:hypothetical protein